MKAQISHVLIAIYMTLSLLYHAKFVISDKVSRLNMMNSKDEAHSLNKIEWEPKHIVANGHKADDSKTFPIPKRNYNEHSESPKDFMKNKINIRYSYVNGKQKIPFKIVKETCLNYVKQSLFGQHFNFLKDNISDFLESSNRNTNIKALREEIDTISDLIQNLEQKQKQGITQMSLDSFIINGLADQTDAYLKNTFYHPNLGFLGSEVDKVSNRMVHELFNNEFDDDFILEDTFLEDSDLHLKASSDLVKRHSAHKQNSHIINHENRKAANRKKRNVLGTTVYPAQNLSSITVVVTKSSHVLAKDNLKKALKMKEQQEKKAEAVRNARKQLFKQHTKNLKSLRSGCERKAAHSEFLKKMAQQKVSELKLTIHRTKVELKKIINAQRKKESLKAIQISKMIKLKDMKIKQLREKSLQVRQRALKIKQNRLKERGEISSKKVNIKKSLAAINRNITLAADSIKRNTKNDMSMNYF
ncbi:unnamed protein product [Gordionus sp. m RMFG-2023]|uniref:uncharacterized protein LOC135924683 n=1 Tax=Gordionus sp. m RMFG-2023 TaxID=3053472 RepID=UPI0030E36AEC